MPRKTKKKSSSRRQTKSETQEGTRVQETEVQESEIPPKLSPTRVLFVGTALIVLGMIGFHTIPDLIAPDAGGNPIINAFYCSVMTLTTVGFGDICPGNFSDPIGDVFLLVLPILGLGFFCGPILTMASFWQSRVPGGVLSLASLTLALGVSMLIVFEGMSTKDAIHLSIITGTTIGYGNITPASDPGRFFLAIYAIMVCNVAAGFLDKGRLYLESFCHDPAPSKKLKGKIE
mmetsp:Transcript_19800/g.45165  ORF Transcript_19800/g.45165 Transcript_19800/m.45165 type:complete len:232 (+) Transcript_19800:169-864(+)|eukprot:CAMPEP_0201146532 /NCGR_PEP_ID=MMETSP0851-20130426/8193_1 /ASSEMBLY_ACC=CAM_ASM_000631 /TAXON_ID=183588 /ORGANISM="Pseudo-nitzschia fraudulenta, Strain WWA7" /LENGTH=231 /DNA_ID=CAMNT_0047422091 /DNA_START=171 /DNA_END=866 /DNA_ORIENTATION=-